MALLIDGLVSESIGRLVVRSVASFPRSVTRSVGQRVAVQPVNHSLPRALARSLARSSPPHPGGSTPGNRSIDRPNERPMDRSIHRLSDGPIKRTSERPSERPLTDPSSRAPHPLALSPTPSLRTLSASDSLTRLLTPQSPDRPTHFPTISAATVQIVGHRAQTKWVLGPQNLLLLPLPRPRPFLQLLVVWRELVVHPRAVLPVLTDSFAPQPALLS